MRGEVNELCVFFDSHAASHPKKCDLKLVALVSLQEGWIVFGNNVMHFDLIFPIV
jgi:hypothetical protein